MPVTTPVIAWSSTWGRSTRRRTACCASCSRSDGERVIKATPDVGYLHRGKEKVAETLGYHRYIPYTDRLDYLAPLANNCSATWAFEKVCGIEAPAARPVDSRDLSASSRACRPTCWGSAPTAWTSGP